MHFVYDKANNLFHAYGETIIDHLFNDGNGVIFIEYAFDKIYVRFLYDWWYGLCRKVCYQLSLVCRVKGTPGMYNKHLCKTFVVDYSDERINQIIYDITAIEIS